MNTISQGRLEVHKGVIAAGVSAQTNNNYCTTAVLSKTVEKLKYVIFFAWEDSWCSGIFISSSTLNCEVGCHQHFPHHFFGI